MRRLMLAMGLVAAMGAGQARGDIIILAGPAGAPGLSVSGMILLNTTTGAFVDTENANKTSFSVGSVAFGPFIADTITSQGTVGGNYDVVVSSVDGKNSLTIVIPQSSVVGYTGGFYTGTADFNGSDVAYSGEFLDAGSAVPEPSTYALACVGGIAMLGVGVVRGRRV